MQKKKTIKKKHAYLIIGCVLGILAGLLLGWFLAGTVSNVSERTGTKQIENKSDENMYKIESLYCDLYYPAKWEEMLTVEEELNAVHFTADLDENKIIDLFDVVVVETEESESENAFEVHIIMFDLEFDEQWNDEEKQTALTMQKDAAVICDYLEKENIKVIY